MRTSLFLREGNESGHGRPARAFENPVTIKDGSERVIAWNSDRLTSIDGDLTGLIACGQGVTEYKRLQGQLLQAQKMESIGQLAGGVAHDFNNPLSIILFDVDMLLAAAQEETSLREDLQKIRKVVLRASDLTRQLLVFSRRQHIEPELMSLNAHIAGQVSARSWTTSQKSVKRTRDRDEVAK